LTLPVVWTPQASADLGEAWLWYENRRAGLGDRFLEAADATVSAIADNPRQFAVRHRAIRRARVRGFPYGIFFIAETDRAVVIACFHARRDPRRWQSREEP
jgi:plasmid stabilization system protein ParE